MMKVSGQFQVGGGSISSSTLSFSSNRYYSSLPPPPPPPHRRVVVTGLGLVTPLGINVQTSWQRIVNGESGIKRVSKFDIGSLSPLQQLPCKVAGEVPSSGPEAFLIENWVPKDYRAQMTLPLAYSIAAARQAMDDSGWDGDRNTCGVAIGCGLGSMDEIQTTHDSYKNKDQGFRRVSPYFVTKILVNMASGYVSIIHGLRGPNHAVSTACATGAHSIGDAASFIQRGLATAMLAGATEGSINPIVMAGFAKAKALSSGYNDTPSKASRPFDSKRDGFVMAEGSGMVMLEEMESAIKRGAKIYAELRGYGLSGEGFHITQPTPDGNAAKRCMHLALSSAGLEPRQVDYVNAHATSTPIGDVAEISAIEEVFKEQNPNVAISSTKGATGHLLAAAGAVEAIFCILALRDGVIPPTINLENVDENINPKLNLPKTAIKKDIKVAMTNSFGFGGTNASLIFSKFQ